MTQFVKYMHVERFGTDEVQGIELGNCHIFPKIDGTNASVWLGADGQVNAGSRNRHLSLGADNAGFLAWAIQNEAIKSFLTANPHLRLYGEWLVPHSLNTYREEAWRRFYVFDVQDDQAEKLLPYEVYAPLLEAHGVDCIHPATIIKNATYDNLLHELSKNVYLIQDGKGAGEGIVIKNYQYQNKFGRTTWAKLVTTEFKEANTKAFGPALINGSKMAEQEIVDEFVTDHLVNKTFAKISNECEGWSSKYIPRLLNTVFHDLVNEEMWNAVKKFKNPTVNFKTLHSLTVLQVKTIRPELF